MAKFEIVVTDPLSEHIRCIADILSGQCDMEVIEAPSVRGVGLLSLVRRTDADVLVIESRPKDTPFSMCSGGRRISAFGDSCR